MNREPSRFLAILVFAAAIAVILYRAIAIMQGWEQ